MGIFGGRTTTYVSSTVYNLAGDLEEQPSVARSILVGQVLKPIKGTTYANVLNSSLMSGNGMKQRQFFRWAQTNYALGMPADKIGGSSPVDIPTIQGTMEYIVGLPSGDVLQISEALIDFSNVRYWAEEWILNNYVGLTDEDWSVEWIPTSLIIRVTVDPSIPGHVTHDIAAPADLIWAIGDPANRKLLYCFYRIFHLGSAGPQVLYTYRIGDGITLFDALSYSSTGSTSEFFPVIPLRLNNVGVLDSGLSFLETPVRQAYRKLTGQSLTKLVASIEDNPDLADIDFCFLVQGACLNSKDQASLNYLYQFFLQMMASQNTTKSSLDIYLDYRQSVLVDGETYTTWRSNKLTELAAAGTPSSSGALDIITSRLPDVSELQVYSPSLVAFNYVIQWLTISEEQFLGNAKSYDGDLTRGTLAKGDYWFIAGPDTTLPAAGALEAETIEKVWLFYQNDVGSYSRIEIQGMSHRNYVYGGVAVYTTAKEAVNNTTEPSGFLMPLHYPTFKDLSLLKCNQLATSNSYLVFNCYVEKKQRWYETGIFRIVMIVAVAVLTVVVPPAGAGLAGAGILGTNLAIGTSLGFTTATTAAIAGALANSIAAMIVTSLIQQGATMLFGEKFGAIIGTAISFLAMNYAAAYVNTGKFDIDWGSMMRADNLTKLTNSTATAYSAWNKAELSDRYADFGKLQSAYEDQAKVISDLSEQILGMTSGEIDPMMSLDDDEEYFAESPESFMDRTTMTGDDIAELSLAMVSDFAEMTLDLPDGVDD